MENFIVSARKYRPQTFDTVIGQLHITGTLKNAIKTEHVAQAYLFCGPRGVGKTTCARILAKTLNCFNITKEIEACDKCESCRSFNEGHSLNIYELDAASNNSVEDIRNLINQVSFAPQIGTKKVYIIDEVHMLSQAAFNAFLKTLEEPPRHAIFILATTEKHKIIPTILSRCQIFDFNRIRIEDTVSHLAAIAKKEKVKAEEDALHIIAQKADGAMRDALSMFDQMVSISGNNITYKTVIDNLSILDYDYYFKITDALLSQNTASALLLFNEILNKGFDGHHFINGLAGHFRDLLVCRDEITIQLLEVSAGIREKYKSQSKNTQPAFLLRGLEILNRADVQYKASRNQRLLVEMTLLQLCSLSGSGAEKKNDEPGLIAPIQRPAAAPASAVAAPATETAPRSTAPATPTKTTATAAAPPSKPATAPAIAKTPATASSTATPKTAANTSPRMGRPGMLTISAMTNGHVPKFKEQKGEYQQPPTTPSAEPVGLQESWKQFADFLKTKNKINLATTLTSHEPEMETDETILFRVMNQVQEDDINAIRTDLLVFVREKMKKPDLQLKILVDKTDTGRKPYTGEEKYQRLAEKNPLLDKLRQQFHLDIDY